jgi:hypothetical protein
MTEYEKDLLIDKLTKELEYIRLKLKDYEDAVNRLTLPAEGNKQKESTYDQHIKYYTRIYNLTKKSILCWLKITHEDVPLGISAPRPNTDQFYRTEDNKSILFCDNRFLSWVNKSELNKENAYVSFITIDEDFINLVKENSK